MLRLRRAELAARIAADHARLRQVEARLRSIESEGTMSNVDVQTRPLPAVRLAQLTGVAAGYGPQHVGPVIRPRYAELTARLAAAGVPVVGPAVAWYEDTPDGGLVVHAGLTVAAAPGTGVRRESAEQA
jgi:hypothetical protein